MPFRIKKCVKQIITLKSTFKIKNVDLFYIKTPQMSNFLRKINLIKDINIELQVSKTDFIKKFRENVDESDLGFEPFEALKSSQNEYKGNIENNSFELKKRRKLFDTNYSFAKVTGQIIQETDKLIIKTQISAFQGKMIFFMAFLLLFYAIFISAFLFTENGGIKFFIFPFILFHMSIMMGIPYFIMKRSVTRMIYDLERDLHYWVTKN